MKKAFITAIAIMTVMTQMTAQPPTLYALAQERDALPPDGGAGGGKILGIFRSEKQAKTWTTVAGYICVAAAAIPGGNAERIRMYEGTRSNNDAFHLQRDASLCLLGLGTSFLAVSVTIGEKIKPLEIAWKIPSAAILYRVTAEATYNVTKPR